MDRLLIYSHDTYGLGHLRRCLRVAAAALHTGSARAVLIVTGSPQASSFDLPSGVDVVKLPAVTKADDGGYRSRTLDLGLDHMIDMRAGLVLAAARSFRPDTVLIDHAPVGMARELEPLLDALPGMRPRPALVLGMRDIVDLAAKVEADWMSTGAWDRLHEVYDGVIVYGDPVVRTTALEMDLAGRLPIPVEHVGFVAPPPTERLHRGCRRPTIVVTAGGGGDGLPLLEAYTEFLTRSSLRADVRSVLVTGPLSDADPASDLLARVSGAPVEILRFSDRMEPLLATADAAITMAGYNTVAELLAFEIPAVLIPRTFPRVEQWLRATRISAVADFVPVAADEITVEHVDALVRDVLERRAVRRHQLDLDGARATARALVRVCRTRFAQVV